MKPLSNKTVILKVSMDLFLYSVCAVVVFFGTALLNLHKYIPFLAHTHSTLGLFCIPLIVGLSWLFVADKLSKYLTRKFLPDAVDHPNFK